VGLKRGVWHVSRECEGIAEAGGLKDVVAGLAAALAGAGIATAVVLPRYGFIDLDRLKAQKAGQSFNLLLPSENRASPLAVETVEVYSCGLKGVPVFLLDSPRTRSKRAIYTYTAEDEHEDPYKKKGTGHWDAHHINLILQRGALELALRLGGPDVFHCHDGHSAFLPAMMKGVARYREKLRDCRALITIHNAGKGYHQEIYDREFAAQLTELPGELLEKGMLGGAVDPFLVGARFATVNTVSEGYAREINSGQLDELTGGLGTGLKKAGVELLGITNGIAPETFDPRFPENTGLPFSFDPSRGKLEGKEACRQRFIELLAAGGDSRGPELNGLEIHGSLSPHQPLPLYTFVGRLTGQKGVDVLAGAFSRLLEKRAGWRLLVLGQGERAIEEKLIEMTRLPRAAGKLCVLIGYNNLAARYLYASGDFFLVPSRYEPCGLTDLFAQMMGNLPIVHAVGGLIKVRDGSTGYSYREHSITALVKAVEKSLSDYRNRRGHLLRLQKQAFQEVYKHYTWEKVLRKGYLPLYGLEG
jgi:starch synthase